MNAFNIVTEFRFDIAHAVADSKTLQNQVGLISDTANQALYSLRRVGFGLVAQMGLFSGGTLGFLNSALQSSEKFGQSQRKLANIFLANKELFNGSVGDPFASSGLTFTSAMKQSAKIMDDIRKKGFEFAVDPSQLLSQTSAIAPMLLSHGLDDGNLGKSIDISRGLMKSAPTLGIDPGLVQGQLINLVLGRADLNNTLFQRLMSETKPFKENNINDSKSFNVMPAQKRIEMLRQALLQFGSNAEVIAGNVNSMTGQMQKFMSLVKGEFSVLKRLGDAMMVPVIKAFQYINNWIDTNGRQIIESATRLIQDFVADPVKAYEKLRQVGRLKSDLMFAGKLTYLYGIIHGGIHVLELLGIQLGGMSGVVRTVVMGIRAALGWLLAIVPWAKVFGFAMMALRGIFLAVARVLFPLVFLMQIWSATLAKLEVIWASWMANNSGRMAQALERIGTAFTKIIYPITAAISGVAEILSSILGWFVTKDILIWGLEAIGVAFEFLGKIIVGFISLIAGLTNILIGQIANLIQGNLKNLFSGTEYKDLFMEGMQDHWYRHYPKDQKDGGADPAISTQNTYINKVEINQQFKEQQEPDRIAFSLEKMLKKVAMNPSQSANRAAGKVMVGN